MLRVLDEGDVELLARLARHGLDARRVEARHGCAGQCGEVQRAAVHPPTVCREGPLGWHLWADPETLANLPLARTALDRAADRRSDPGLVPRLLRDPATRVLVIRDGSAEVVEDGGRPMLALRPPVPADAHALAVFLGVDGDDTAYLAVDDAAADSGDAGDLRTLRQVGVELDDRDAGLLTTALGLLNWHRAHPHCPVRDTHTGPVRLAAPVSPRRQRALPADGPGRDHVRRRRR